VKTTKIHKVRFAQIKVFIGGTMRAGNLLTFKEKRSDHRKMVDQFHSVEIFLPELTSSYLFKLRDISEGGMGVFVNKNSLILNYIRVGDKREIKFCAPKKTPELLTVQIKHIFKCEKGPFRDHCVVGLSICDE
jgi:hypothetical protein